MICVRAGLYIGAASDLKDGQELASAGITHILSVDSEEPDLQGSFQRKFVCALDDPCTDLLSSLDACVQFISDALAIGSSAVLVHCHAGCSRSAAVVTAYLMKSDKLSLMKANTILQEIKPNVRINEGFLNQLELYESMGCEVDVTSPVYKQYRLQKVTEKYPELQSVPKEVFAADPSSSGQTHDSDPVYRCRKCRRTLFRCSSIMNHNAGTGPAAFTHKKIGWAQTAPAAQDQNQCTSHFIEPVQWMEQALLGVLDGQLLCPKCNSKLGSFNWYGEQCSCGRWVTPAFQIHKNRVDEIKHIHVPGLRSGHS